MRIYIAEDEPLATQKLRLFLDKLGEAGDVRTFDNGVSLMAALQDEVPDLIFLDIQMPGLTGMEVLQRLDPKRQPLVIITSAYEQYALPSFSYNVADYLLKPYTLERLRQAVDKAREQLRLRRLDQEQQQRANEAPTLQVRVDGQTLNVPLDNILSLEAIKDYVRLTTVDGKRHLVLSTLSSMESLLPPDTFIRTHRSFIINISKVTAFTLQQVTLSDGQVIPVGRTYRDAVRTHIANC